MKEHLFDKRVVKRALQEGLVSKEDYQRMLEALPDLSHSLQSNSNDIDVNTGVDDDDDDDDADDVDDVDDDVQDDDAHDDDALDANAHAAPSEPEQLAGAQAVHTPQETHDASDAEPENPAEHSGNTWASEI